VSHPCHDPLGVTLNKQDNIGRFLDRLLITFQPLPEQVTDIRGFPLWAMNDFMGNAATDKIATLARGEVIGGTREYIEVASLVFNVIVAETLRGGYLGTEENILRCGALSLSSTHDAVSCCGAAQRIPSPNATVCCVVVRCACWQHSGQAVPRHRAPLRDARQRELRAVLGVHRADV
jgi:hypothetical protein